MTETGRSTLRTAGRSALVAAVVLMARAVVVGLAKVPEHARARCGCIVLRQFSRLLLHALDIRVVTAGRVHPGPALVVANHQSWLDVLVLSASGAMLPVLTASTGPPRLIDPCSFGALTVPQRSGRSLPGSVDQVTSLLRRGHRALAFPCAPGQHGPFPRAFFQSAVDAGVVVSPAAVSYHRADLVPMSRLPLNAALVGADRVGPLHRVLLSGPLVVRVQFLPAIPAIVSHGHRTHHRTAVAERTEAAIGRALRQPVVGAPAKRPPPAQQIAVAGEPARRRAA